MQGGVGDYTREMARAYADLGHSVIVITSRLSDPRQAAGAWGLRPVVARWDWGSWSVILSVIREVRPGVVNIQFQAAAYAMQPAIHLLPLRLWLMRSRPRVVVTYHDLRVPYLFPKAGRLRWWAVLALAHWSDAVIATNAEDEARLAVYPFIRRITRIPIGSNIPPLPPAGYDRMAWRARWGVAPDDVLLAYFGFLNESKGGETLIRALARLGGDVKLLMVGGKVGSSDPTNAAYAERIEALITELGLAGRVLWTGYTPQAEVSANLLAADIGVFPYKDGVSLRRGSLMAALAHGLPIVSTRYPSAKTYIPNQDEWWHPAELRDGDNILLVPPDDEAALADAIARLIASPALRERLGQGAKTLSARFGWPEIAKQTLVVYHEIGA